MLRHYCQAASSGANGDRSSQPRQNVLEYFFNLLLDASALETLSRIGQRVALFPQLLIVTVLKVQLYVMLSIRRTGTVSGIRWSSECQSNGPRHMFPTWCQLCVPWQLQPDDRLLHHLPRYPDGHHVRVHRVLLLRGEACVSFTLYSALYF